MVIWLWYWYCVYLWSIHVLVDLGKNQTIKQLNDEIEKEKAIQSGHVETSKKTNKRTGKKVNELTDSTPGQIDPYVPPASTNSMLYLEPNRCVVTLAVWNQVIFGLVSVVTYTNRFLKGWPFAHRFYRISTQCREGDRQIWRLLWNSW